MDILAKLPVEIRMDIFDIYRKDLKYRQPRFRDYDFYLYIATNEDWALHGLSCYSWKDFPYVFTDIDDFGFPSSLGQAPRHLVI